MDDLLKDGEGIVCDVCSYIFVMIEERKHCCLSHEQNQMLSRRHWLLRVRTRIFPVYSYGM